MNSIRWHKPKWLPRLLAMPTPEPAEQAARILSIQRSIILPAKLMVIVVVAYYLFFSDWIEVGSALPPAAQNRGSTAIYYSPRVAVLETLQGYFIFYVIFNVLAGTLLLLRRFPHRLVQWVVFTAGLIDGLLLAGLTVQTGGFGSDLFWVFPGLIVVNALSIPLATPQIVLNLFLSGLYLGAGLLNFNISETESVTDTMYQAASFVRRGSVSRFAPGDLSDLDALATRLKQPSPTDAVSRFIVTNLSANTLSNLANNAEGGLRRGLTDDLNKIIDSGQSIYDKDRFNGVNISVGTSNLLKQNPQGTANISKLNRELLQDAYSAEIPRQTAFMRNTSRPEQPTPTETTSESFILQLMILWLMTASCYGVQLLSFRHRVAEEEERKSAARNDELRAAGRLAAEIAHRLKNPLGIINNAVFSLQRGMREGRNDFNLQFEIIREEIDRSDRILTQLMGYAQLSEGRVERLNLAEEADRAILEVFPPGTEYEIKIERRFETGLPDLLVQRNHISVVLVNLLQNAREVLNGRGVISIHALRRGDFSLEIIVGDNGPGIPGDKLNKVFEPYFTSKDKGTGLGLAIVKHNVELYGGTVAVESELGKGARFVLSFPSKTFIEAAV